MRPSPEGLPSNLAIPILLLAVTFGVFAPSLTGDFVFDDHRFVPDNAAIRDLGNLGRFFTDARTMTATQGVPGWDDIYRPLRTLSFAVDWALFGASATGYRVVSLLWHLGAVFLAWRLMRRILGRADLAALAAGVFALHPLQSQSVAWISSRGDLMSAVFLLGAALLILEDRVSVARAAAAAGLYALALLGKESAVALPALVIAYDLLLAPKPRFRWRLLIVLAAVTTGFLLLRFSVATGQGAFEIDRLSGAGSAAFVLLGHTLFPVRLLPYTGDVLYATVMETTAGGALLALGVLGLGAVVARGRQTPRLAFGLLWAALCLAPSSGIVPLKSLAESRFAYLPLLGIGVLLALLARRTGRAGLALGLVALVILGAATVKEARIWGSHRSLWETAVRREADYAEGGDIAWSNLALARGEDGDDQGAVEAFLKALDRRPTAGTQANLARLLADRGRVDRAVEVAIEAVRFDPSSVPAREVCGDVLIRAGRAAEAIGVLEPAVRAQPRYARVRARYGEALLGAGRVADAIAALTTARRLAPDQAWIHVLGGRAFVAARRPDDAVAAFEEAHRLDPNNAGPLLLAGRTRLSASDPVEAVAVLTRALEVDPDLVAARAERLAAISLLERGFSGPQMAEFLDCLDRMEEDGDLLSVSIVLRRLGIWGLRVFDLQLRLVRAHLDLGHREDAEEAGARALELADDDGQRAMVRALLEGSD